MPVDLHRIMMQTQVTRISIRRTIDPMRNSELIGEPYFIPEDIFIFIYALSIQLLGWLGVLSQHPYLD